MSVSSDLPIYHVVITVKPCVPVEEMNWQDGGDPSLVSGGIAQFWHRAASAEEAEESALDEFHGNIAIAVLDHFDITTKARLMSSHEILEKEQESPGFTAEC